MKVVSTPTLTRSSVRRPWGRRGRPRHHRHHVGQAALHRDIPQHAHPTVSELAPALQIDRNTLNQFALRPRPARGESAWRPAEPAHAFSNPTAEAQRPSAATLNTGDQPPAEYSDQESLRTHRGGSWSRASRRSCASGSSDKEVGLWPRSASATSSTMSTPQSRSTVSIWGSTK